MSQAEGPKEGAVDDAASRERARFYAPTRRALALHLLGFGLLASLTALAYEHRPTVNSFLRGEIGLDGEPRYSPPYEVAQGEFESVDLQGIHERLIPRWSIARARARAPSTRAWADAMREQLIEAMRPDPNLVELWRDLDLEVRGGAVANRRRIEHLLWSHNHYLAERGAPFRVEASIYVDEEGYSSLWVRTYEVLDDREAAGTRLRMVRRADRTNLVDGFLGQTRPEDGSTVMLSRVLHFAARHVWPALHPALDERLPETERRLAPFVRREVRADLPGPRVALLEETAEDQQALLEVTAQMRRRQACGSRLRVYDLAFNGLTRSGRRALQYALARSENSPCPEVTVVEAARLFGASERLQSTDGIEDAVEALTTFVARSVAVHELRHAMDPPDEALTCPGCPAGLSPAARAEVSGYLEALAHEGLGYTALLQTCASGLAHTGPHGRAIRAVHEALLPDGCEGEIPSDLYAQASLLRRLWFGARDEAELPMGLPPIVRLLPRAGEQRWRRRERY